MTDGYDGTEDEQRTPSADELKLLYQISQEKDVMERKLDDAEPTLKETLDKQIKNYENMLAHIQSPCYHEVLQKLMTETEKYREELDTTNNTPVSDTDSANSNETKSKE